MKIVLLHAFPLDERMWEPQLEALREHEAVAPRLYGRGSSVDAWAEQLLGEVDGRFVAVGASMGGYCALAMARRAPERVAGLVLAGSRAAADSDERKQFRNALIARLQSDGVPPEMNTGVPAEELAVASEALRDRPDATEAVRTFARPLLVCVGDRDELLPVEEARAVAKLAPNGRLAVFEGAGHLVSVERPDEFNEVLLRFVAQWT